jgi:hypothetical protein
VFLTKYLLSFQIDLKVVGWKENNQLNGYLIKRSQGIEALTLNGPNKSVF